MEGLAETVENVSLAQLQDTDSCQLVVGYTAAQNDHYLAVYSLSEGHPAHHSGSSSTSSIWWKISPAAVVRHLAHICPRRRTAVCKSNCLPADREGSFRQVAVNGLSR